MKLLLDTHAFLWWVAADARLSGRATAAIEAVDNEVFFSVASAWELAIKLGLGRYELSEPLDDFIGTQLERNDFEVLPIRLAHAVAVSDLPRAHRDPFDRLLIVQAREEDMTLVSADRALAAYDVELLW